MKAEDLRIGNLVLYKWFDKNSVNGKQRTVIHREVVKILAVDSVNNRVLIKTNQTRKNHTWISIGCIAPIPLTDDILLKCGFVKMDNKHNFYILGYEINFKIDKKIKWVAWCNTVLANVEVKYLHQLQNLYYALTGEELEVRI